jgi:sugar phosphate isomerase/epimerase
MSNRRDFLKQSGSLTLGSLLFARNQNLFSDLNSKSIRAVGLQLYTVTGLMDKDTKDTLQKIAAIGYREVESAFSRKGGYYGMKPKEFAQMVNDTGLSWQSHHVGGAPFKLPPGAKPPVDANGKPIVFPPMKNLKENFQELVDEAAEGGVNYLVCASIPLNTLDEIKEAIDILTKTGEACKKAKITLAYHNHTHEFEKVDGEIPYDLLLSQTNVDILKMELDLGWATKAGVDPVALFTKNPGRFPLWHVKDINKDSKNPTEVGNGYVDFKRIFENEKIAGMQHFFVEQDNAPQPLENIATSFNNLKKILT